MDLSSSRLNEEESAKEYLGKLYTLFIESLLNDKNLPKRYYIKSRFFGDLEYMIRNDKFGERIKNQKEGLDD